MGCGGCSRRAWDVRLVSWMLKLNLSEDEREDGPEVNPAPPNPWPCISDFLKHLQTPRRSSPDLMHRDGPRRGLGDFTVAATMSRRVLPPLEEATAPNARMQRERSLGESRLQGRPQKPGHRQRRRYFARLAEPVRDDSPVCLEPGESPDCFTAAENLISIFARNPVNPGSQNVSTTPWLAA